jgi:hypothetical protein
VLDNSSSVPLGYGNGAMCANGVVPSSTSTVLCDPNRATVERPVIEDSSQLRPLRDPPCAVVSSAAFTSPEGKLVVSRR